MDPKSLLRDTCAWAPLLSFRLALLICLGVSRGNRQVQVHSDKCRQATSQDRVGEVGGLLPRGSPAIVLCWQGSGTALAQASFPMEVSVRNAWKKSICSTVCKRTAVSLES